MHWPIPAGEEEVDDEDEELEELDDDECWDEEDKGFNDGFLGGGGAPFWDATGA